VIARPRHARRLLVATITAAAVAGCASSPRPPRAASPYTTPSEASRDTITAQRLHQEAARLVDSDPTRAEELLRLALAADIFFGPAHNNLGVLFLSRGQLFEAASEFEWACKLMPGQPDPRVNLALTLESAGRTDGALDAYATALEVSPGYLPAIQGLASLQLRTGQADHRTPDLLEQIAMRGDETWRMWAIGQIERQR
jgi:Flp pilus assembly protein TadD